MSEGPALTACVEVGGSGHQTALFPAEGEPRFVDGPSQPGGAELRIATPGIIEGLRVLAASNLGWFDIDPANALGLTGPVTLLMNDAEAAALGEAALLGSAALERLVYVGLGTGVGGAVVANGQVVVANLFGHQGGFGTEPCRCGQSGCLETVAAGWALPASLSPRDLEQLAAAAATALVAEPSAAEGPVVIAGGIPRRYPELVERVAKLLPDRSVLATSAPTFAKSASAWGLMQASASVAMTPPLRHDS